MEIGWDRREIDQNQFKLTKVLLKFDKIYQNSLKLIETNFNLPKFDRNWIKLTKIPSDQSKWIEIYQNWLEFGTSEWQNMVEINSNWQKFDLNWIPMF